MSVVHLKHSFNKELSRKNINNTTNISETIKISDDQIKTTTEK